MKSKAPLSRSASLPSYSSPSLARSTSNRSLARDYRDDRLTGFKSQGDMALFGKSLAGPGYVILNILRAVNIIGLLLAAAASGVLLARIVIISQLFFFDALSHVFAAIISIFLTVSELSIFKNYFERNWPVLSSSHGFVSLGSAMIVLGTNLLGSLNKPSTSQKALGLGFWRLVIGSGIIIFALGFFNIFASYIFRSSTPLVTARQIRSHGAVALSARIAQAPEFEPSTKALSIITSSSRYSGSSQRSPAVLAPREPPPRPTAANRAARTLRAARESLYWPARYRVATPRKDGDVPPVPAPPYPGHSPVSRIPTNPSPVNRSPIDRSPIGRNPMNRSPVEPPKKKAGQWPLKDKPKDKGKGKESAKEAKEKEAKREMRTVAPVVISAPLNVNPQFAHLIKRPDTTYHPARQQPKSPGDGSGWV